MSELNTVIEDRLAATEAAATAAGVTAGAAYLATEELASALLIATRGENTYLRLVPAGTNPIPAGQFGIWAETGSELKFTGADGTIYTVTLTSDM